MMAKIEAGQTQKLETWAGTKRACIESELSWTPKKVDCLAWDQESEDGTEECPCDDTPAPWIESKRANHCY